MVGAGCAFYEGGAGDFQETNIGPIRPIEPIRKKLFNRLISCWRIARGLLTPDRNIRRWNIRLWKRLLKRETPYLIDAVYGFNGQCLPYILRQFDQVLGIILGQDNSSDARSMRGLGQRGCVVDRHGDLSSRGPAVDIPIAAVLASTARA